MTHAPDRRPLGIAATSPSHELLRLTILCTIVALQLDWATKSWALQALGDGSLPLGSLVLGVIHNDAFVFSTGAGSVSRIFVVAVRLAALLLLAGIARSAGVAARRDAAGVGFIIGGGLGNIADLLLREHGVVDFIGTGPVALVVASWRAEFHLVFNLADVAVLVGIGLLAPLIRNWALALQQRLRAWERRWLLGDS